MMPGKYRKVPVQISAMQVERPFEDVAGWCGGTVTKFHGDSAISIVTLEGEMVALQGDWIIRGVFGEFYPCKDRVFRETYVAVDPPDEPFPGSMELPGMPA